MILDAIRESSGCAVAVDENRILEWMRLATSTEGISICPEAAACVGAAESLAASGWIERDEQVVLFNCGAAQKYPQLGVHNAARLERDAELEWDWIARGGDAS
jgi:threonine synthase